MESGVAPKWSRFPLSWNALGMWLKLRGSPEGSFRGGWDFSQQQPAPFQPRRSKRARFRGWGLPGVGGRDPEEAQYQTPQVLGAAALVSKIRPKPTPSRPVKTARPAPRVPIGVSANPGRRKRSLPQPGNDQALPCPASLWPRRSGPRPRTSLGGCGSWSSAQERLTPQTRPQRVWNAHRALDHTPRDENRERRRGHCFRRRRRTRLTSFEGAEGKGVGQRWEAAGPAGWGIHVQCTVCVATNGLFRTVAPVTVSASLAGAVNKIGALGVSGRFPPTFILPAVS